MRRVRLIPLCVAALTAVSPAVAAPPESVATNAYTPPPSPLDAIGDDALSAVAGWQWLYLAGAIAATASMSPTGADHAIRVAVQRHARVPAWGDAAYYGGYILPVLLPVSVYVGGLIADDRTYAGAGAAAIQALAFTELVTVVFKVGVGRPFPLNGGNPSAPDRLDHPEYAHSYSPFGFEGRYAWPSGHTAAAMSIAAALTAYSDDPVLVGAVSYPVAAAIAFGMLTGDHHWASDIVAGGLLGQGIGWSVGKSFATRRRAERGASAATIEVVPWVSAGVQGVAVAGTM